MERRNADDWDAVKLEELARCYMEMRKEIWSGLAERLGEKWGVVEAKVCSYYFLINVPGLTNIIVSIPRPQEPTVLFPLCFSSQSYARYLHPPHILLILIPPILIFFSSS